MSIARVSEQKWALIAVVIVLLAAAIATAVHSHDCPEDEQRCSLCQGRFTPTQPAPALTVSADLRVTSQIDIPAAEIPVSKPVAPNCPPRAPPC